jgi:predicted RNA-binding Zn-ribbon protein involved in translation (DUF1610 family)
VNGEAAVASITRFGERTKDGAASFRCAACGEAAGVVRTARAGALVDLGPLAGRHATGHDGFVIDYFLGTVWFAADPAAVDAVQAILDAGGADPAALRRIGRDLAPFYCPDCELNYCGADWHAEVLWDEGFYDCTMGTCPHGHRHLLDD